MDYLLKMFITIKCTLGQQVVPGAQPDLSTNHKFGDKQAHGPYQSLDDV